MSEDQYKLMSEDKKTLFDNCALLFCLMIRKEFGQDTYLRLLKETANDEPEKAIFEILEFKDFDRCDRSFKKYVEDLTKGLAKGKTPDSHLQIKEKSN